MTDKFSSWATVPQPDQKTVRPCWESEILPALRNEQYSLAVGNGRSYGDSCLLSGHPVIQMSGLNRLISFDREAGVITAEPGIRFCDLLKVTIPEGWFLPVTPGTSLLTLGGAVANDVHGKNHHCDGTFGHFVSSFKLLRSDASILRCSESENTDYFHATIGGLGLTGVITEVTFHLIPIATSWMDVRYDVFSSLVEFAELSAKNKDSYQYTVAWMDCATPGTVGRGVLMSANHSEEGDLSVGAMRPKATIPFNCPPKLLNTYSIRAFNALYFKSQASKARKLQHEHYKPYFYPLDAIGNWNRIYGAKGFHQYQFVVPADRLDTLAETLTLILNSGLGSFLAVLKEFGTIPSRGMLSFPRVGYCLALDFSERGGLTEKLICDLDKCVFAAGGAAYPAKDKLMSADSFQQYFPRWREFTAYTDPVCTSNFWRRVSAVRENTVSTSGQMG